MLFTESKPVHFFINTMDLYLLSLYSDLGNTLLTYKTFLNTDSVK